MSLLNYNSFNLPYAMGMMLVIFNIFLLNKVFYYWMVLELSLFLYLLVMINKKDKSNYFTFHGLKSKMTMYFIFQTLGSLMFLFGIINKYKIYLIKIGLMLKIGLFPFHWWLIDVGLNLKSINLWILLTMNKVGLLYLMFWLVKVMNINLMLLVKIIMGLFGMLYSFNKLKSMIIYSSFIDSSFMILLSKFNSNFSIYYFMLYTSMLSFLLLKFYLYSKNSLMLLKSMNGKKLSILLLVIIGLPPFMGFYYKLMFLFSSLKSKIVSLSLKFIFLMFVMSMFFQCLSYFKFLVVKMNIEIFNQNSYFGILLITILILSPLLMGLF